MEPHFELPEYISASSASEDDEYFLESSDESDDAFNSEQSKRKAAETVVGRTAAEPDAVPQNIVLKLFNRERTGCFSGRTRSQKGERAFNKVPNRLSFRVKDLIPEICLKRHVYMGLSACGQFLLTYKINCGENPSYDSSNLGFKYTLCFWLFQPHKSLRPYYSCCIFDDHGVDTYKKVTMTQWKQGDLRVLIVHGAAEQENEESYLTFVRVPKLNCLDCKKLQEGEIDNVMWDRVLCLKCNLTVHTKYSTNESDPKFNPLTHLMCPERMLITSNGFVHMLHIDLQQASSSSAPATLSCPMQQLRHGIPTYLSLPQPFKGTPPPESPRRSSSQAAEDVLANKNIVDSIIADFSDIESDSTHSSSSRHNEMQRAAAANSNTTFTSSSVSCMAHKSYDELVFTCSKSSSGVTGVKAGNAPNGGSGASGSAGVSLVSHARKRQHRIMTKSYRNGVISVDLQGSSSSSASVVDKSNAYEFSEDNEKCEKIATLRRRRLAEKKYEFSEDNTENIVPFTKIRMASKSSVVTGLHRSPAPGHYYASSPCASPSSSPHPSHASPSGCDSRHCTPPPMLRASPIALQQQGFCSPPYNLPIGAGGIMRSPSRHVTAAQIYNQKSPPPMSLKPLGALSPLQMSMAKRSYLELGGSMSPNTSVPYLSPRREEMRIVEVPLQGDSMPEKPLCSKKFKRRFVEEDDATSVITSEEDDCISPGYYTSLPMEVHGSCYSEMQMISQASYQQVNCASIVITQHSFDLETFTYYVISTLCQKNHKTYDVFYDWAFELISVCPLSRTIICLLMAQFSARDQQPTGPAHCVNCSRRLDCAFHRRSFEVCVLFDWNMESGQWNVLDYGELKEIKLRDPFTPKKLFSATESLSLAKKAKNYATEMANTLNKVQDYSNTLRVLDCNFKKSKKVLTDLDNMIELYQKRPTGD